VFSVNLIDQFNMRAFRVLPFFLLAAICVNAQSNPLVVRDSSAQKQWVDAKYSSMSLEERLGQLFMVSVASDQSKTATDKITQLIEKEHIGGVIFSTGGPVRQAKLTNAYQKASKIPLLIGMDLCFSL